MMVFSYKTLRKNSVTKVFILYKFITAGMIFLRLTSLKMGCIFATTTLLLNWFYLPYTSFFKSDIPTKHKEGGGGLSLSPQKYLVKKPSISIDGISNVIGTKSVIGTYIFASSPSFFIIQKVHCIIPPSQNQ